MLPSKCALQYFQVVETLDVEEKLSESACHYTHMIVPCVLDIHSIWDKVPNNNYWTRPTNALDAQKQWALRLTYGLEMSDVRIKIEDCQICSADVLAGRRLFGKDAFSEEHGDKEIPFHACAQCGIRMHLKCLEDWFSVASSSLHSIPTCPNCKLAWVF